MKLAQKNMGVGAELTSLKRIVVVHSTLGEGRGAARTAEERYRRHLSNAEKQD